MAEEILSALRKGSMIVAHRGARSVAPENTLAAARKALSCGARMWELDVRLSRDGHPVVVHDPTLDRTSDAPSRFAGRKPWGVHEFSLGELLSLDFGSWFIRDDPFGQIAKGAVSDSELCLYRGERVLTLEEALVFTVQNDWLVNVEIKDLTGLPGDETIASKVAALIVSLGAREKVLVSSFNHGYLAEIRKLDENITTGALVSSPPADPVQLMRSVGAAAYHPALRSLRPGHIRRLKKEGFMVLVWVVNSASIACGLLRNGVDGIFTDFAQKLTGMIEMEKASGNSDLPETL